MPVTQTPHCNMKEKAATDIAAPVVSVAEFKDGQLQGQWRLGGQAVPPASNAHPRPSGLRQLLLSAFMPEGWPDAVSPDYTGASYCDATPSALGLQCHWLATDHSCVWSPAGFVAWNTVQAISSYVRGVLSSHAVFKGIGVGSQVRQTDALAYWVGSA